ncbi:peptidyl-prolyl cis-trans isomerase e-like [Plasmopara halstedii]|uniref:Peptidyl-prolyl cis-trans isomerase e-like n=1 Tax=Plasmopara halstedii TaxID=4781 RepID=A0A0P1B352_PLAHL|nr:peptidyl-prolyl cis-trans isomerase e-like [Plasmopara halstedii]CEG49167.1 peptidyl-prolyl cis-trans isomerase e-like [Plasmopara halstedii]|eukprot:XP_024585536.1 peptidyl-prolyl cis-trans isomerase e-like [Plasmopara halstedii]
MADKRALYVGNLDNQVTEQGLYMAFVPFGPIKSVQIPLDTRSQRGKGFGFIDFEDEADAKAAIDNMDESELFGKTLRVTIAKPDRPKLGSYKPVWAEMGDVTGVEGEPVKEGDSSAVQA